MPMHNPPHPGDFIRTEIIEPTGLSVTAVAKALQVSRPALSSLLNSRPTSPAKWPCASKSLWREDGHTHANAIGLRHRPDTQARKGNPCPAHSDNPLGANVLSSQSGPNSRPLPKHVPNSPALAPLQAQVAAALASGQTVAAARAANTHRSTIGSFFKASRARNHSSVAGCLRLPAQAYCLGSPQGRYPTARARSAEPQIGSQRRRILSRSTTTMDLASSSCAIANSTRRTHSMLSASL